MSYEITFVNGLIFKYGFFFSLNNHIIEKLKKENKKISIKLHYY